MVLRALSKCFLNIITRYCPNSESISGLYSVPRKSSVIFHGSFRGSQHVHCVCLALAAHMATSTCLTKSRGGSSGDVGWMAAVVPWVCLIHVLSCRAPSTVVGSVSPYIPSTSSFLPLS